MLKLLELTSQISFILYDILYDTKGAPQCNDIQSCAVGASLVAQKYTAWCAIKWTWDGNLVL